jgi:hypothetical protein
MSPAETLARLRRFLLAFSILLLGGSLVELFLVEHMEDAVQLVPFVLCGLGALAALAALFRPRRATLLALRVSMAVVFCGSLFGVYQHVSHNFAFQKEVNPNATSGETVRAALGGANPLLAPGILAVAAALALAAAYRHESLERVRDGERL